MFPHGRRTLANDMSGFTSEKLQMNADAMDSYHHVLQYDKLNVHALRGIASILRSEDKYDQAVKYIESILQALPHDGESWSSLGQHPPIRFKGGQS